MKNNSVNSNWDVDALADSTSDAFSAASFRSWRAVVKLLKDRGFSREQAEQILRSKWTRWCREASPSNSKELAVFLDREGHTPTSESVAELMRGG